MDTNVIINAEELFQSNYNDAQELIESPDKVDKLLKRLERKLQQVPKLGGALAYIPKMGLMVNSFFRKQYTEVPIGIITAIIGVLLYFVSPIDAIPDFIPGIGLLDDAAVASASLCLVKSDLDEYMEWRLRTGLDKTSPLKN